MRLIFLLLAILTMVGGIIANILLDQWHMLTGWTKAFLNPVCLMSAFYSFLHISNKYEARMSRDSAAAQLLAKDPRPPVLYLRSFKADAQEDRQLYLQSETQEEKLKEVFSRVGPFIAIGRPGESFPTLGAARMYLGDDWQKTITDMMSQARLIVLRVGATDSLLWEVRHATRELRPEQLLLIVPRGRKNYEQFRSMAQPVFPRPLPEYPMWKTSRARIKGLICFEPDWTASFLAFKHMFLRGNIRDSLPPALQQALQPVYERLGIPWRPPSINWVRLLLFSLLALILILVLYANIQS
jgi:hypothetical protein